MQQLSTSNLFDSLFGSSVKLPRTRMVAPLIEFWLNMVRIHQCDFEKTQMHQNAI